MGVLQTSEIFCQAPSTFHLGKGYRLTEINKEVRPSGLKKSLKMASLSVYGLLSKIDEVRKLAKNEKLIFLQ